MSLAHDAHFVLAMGLVARAHGLLGTHRDWGGGSCVLALPRCKSVHTIGMRYAIDVAFIDRRGVVLRVERDVTPGRLLLCRHAYCTLERPSMRIPWFEVDERTPLGFC